MENEDKEINYKRDVHIDPNNLDVELLEQPDLIYRYGILLSEARHKMDKLKERMDIAFSQSLTQCFETIKSPAEKVKANAQLDSKYLDLQSKYIDSKREVGILQAAYEAISSRKSSLDNLVKFYLNSYFSGSAYGQEPPNLSERQKNFYKTKKGAEESVRMKSNENTKAAVGKRTRSNTNQ